MQDCRSESKQTLIILVCDKVVSVYTNLKSNALLAHTQYEVLVRSPNTLSSAVVSEHLEYKLDTISMARVFNL